MRNIGLALPLLLSGEEIKIKLSLETGANLKGDVDTLTLESFKLYGDFVLLEGAERQKFQQSALTYLIETPQRLDGLTIIQLLPIILLNYQKKTFLLVV